MLSSKERKPVCFYIRPKLASDPYYRTIYPKERNMDALQIGICKKFQVAIPGMERITHVKPNKSEVIVDEHVLGEIAEGQDMVIEFATAPLSTTAPSVSLSDKQLNAFEFNDYIFPFSPPAVEGPEANAREQPLHNTSQSSEEMALFTSPLDFVEIPVKCSLESLPMLCTEPAECIPDYTTMNPTPFSDKVEPGASLPQIRVADALEDPTLDSNKLRAKSKGKSRSTPVLLRPSGEAAGSRHARLLGKNRIAAAKCRVTRREKEAEQSAKLYEKIQENTSLRGVVGMLEGEVMNLTAYLAEHAECIGMESSREEG